MPNPLYEYADPQHPLLRGSQTDDLLRLILAAYAAAPRSQAGGDFTSRLPQPMPWIDPRLERQPGANVFTPIVPLPNLNQSPGQYPTGALGT